METLKLIFNPKVVGYCVEYYLQTPDGNYYLDCEVVDTPDREVIGYYGTQYGTATEDIFIKGSKKFIPKNAKYYTRLVQLSGRDPNFYKSIMEYANS